MITGLHDPRNHVPELAPDDDWGDPPDVPLSRHASGAALPRRKKISDSPETTSAATVTEGLRIEFDVRKAGPDDPGGKPEVREITGKVVQLTPDDENTRRAPRKVVFNPRQARVRPDPATAGENSEWGGGTGHSHRWMIAGGALVVLTVATGLALQPLLNKPTSKGGESPVSVVEPEVVIEGIDTLNELILKQTEAEEIFARFARAATPGDCLPWLRSPVATETLMRGQPHRFAVGPDWSPPKDCAWNVMDVNGLPCATLDGDLPGFRKFSACFVLEDRHLLLDWKATTGYGTADFASLAAGTGDPSEIRGWLQPATHYTAMFSEADFAAFQLLPPEGFDAPPVWCYALRNTPEESALERLFPRGEIVEPEKSPEKVTVTLQRGGPSSAPNQWLVVKLLHKQWISP